MFGGDGADALQGADILGLALGQGEPSATDLDDFVECQIYYDGARAAADRGEAEPFLRARMCEAFADLEAQLRRYLWQRDRFVLEVDLGDRPEDEPRLVGHMRTGDGAEDEWFVVHLLRRLSAAHADVSCRVFDGDGELLLIEAALAAPRWLTPANAEHRCWIRGGSVHLLPKPRPPEPVQLPLLEALARLRSAQGATAAKDSVQRAISARLEGFPKRAVQLSKHVARAVVPAPVARALAAYPQLVAVALDHLPPPPAKELQRLRRDLEGEEAGARFDCEGEPAQEMVCVGVRFTRCHFAWLMGMSCQLPQRFTQKHWRAPAADRGGADDRAMQLGAKLCAGLEAAYLLNTKSATAAIRWPSSEVDQAAVLPPDSPWIPDPALARHASGLQPPVDAAAASSRRAFVQQSELEEPFRQAFLSVLGDPKLAKAVDLASLWRDADDPEDWLQVSAEELDREMAARQAEFEAFDRERASSGSRSAKDSRRAAKEEGTDSANLQRDIAELGQELSGLLARSSSLDGVEVSPADAQGAAGAGDARAGGQSDDSDDSGSEGPLDVLGMEEEGEEDEEAEENGRGERTGSIRDYMTELDEQLEEELDSKLPDGAAEGPTGDAMPLGSHHIKVHSSGPMELDMHAMEHLLASYCSEHQLSPGPASLLLGELGLAGRAATGAGLAAGAQACCLSAMD